MQLILVVAMRHGRQSRLSRLTGGRRAAYGKLGHIVVTPRVIETAVLSAHPSVEIAGRAAPPSPGAALVGFIASENAGYITSHEVAVDRGGTLLQVSLGSRREP